MRWIWIPSRSHQTARVESPKSAWREAKGAPLSVRIACGQAEVLERSLEHREGELRAGRIEAFAGEQVARAVIGDGQRIAVCRLPSMNSPL